jgi:hypothetical protein
MQKLKLHPNNSYKLERNINVLCKKLFNECSLIQNANTFTIKFWTLMRTGEFQHGALWHPRESCSLSLFGSIADPTPHLQNLSGRSVWTGTAEAHPVRCRVTMSVSSIVLVQESAPDANTSLRPPGIAARVLGYIDGGAQDWRAMRVPRNGELNRWQVLRRRSTYCLSVT